MLPAADEPSKQERFLTIEGYAEQDKKRPLALAIAVHLAVVLFMLLPSSLFDFSPDREEIYTVNLFEALESAPAKPAPAPAPVAKKQEITPPPPSPPVVKKMEPQPVKEPVAIEKTEQVISTHTESPAPAEVISLKPRAVKKDLKPKKTEVKPSAKEEIKVNQALNRIKNELDRKRADKQAKEMQAQAEAAVDDAVAKLRDSIRAQGMWTSSSRTKLPGVKPSSSGSFSGSGSGSSGTGAGPGGGKADPALNKYYAAVSQKIHEHWILPEMQEWKKDLKALVVVHVRRDGVVPEYEFEEKSGNPFFDQFVEKTLKESLPLPPFPEDLEDASLEIGLVFHPSGLQ